MAPSFESKAVQIVYSKIPSSLACLCLFLVAISSVSGQRFHVHIYTELDGLPSSEVNGMVQSLDGRMWFATRNGIACYDGRTWTIHGTSQGLLELDHSKLALDDAGRIWAISSKRTVAVAVLEGDRWRQLPRPKKFRRPTALMALNGANAPRAIVGFEKGVLLFENDTWSKLAFDSDTKVYGFARFRNVIYAASDVGLLQVQLVPEPKLLHIELVPAKRLKGLAADQHNDRLWLIGEDWIDTFDGKQLSQLNQQFNDVASKSESPVRAIASPNGGLYFGTRDGLYSYHPESGIDRMGTHNGLAADGVHNLMFDREGALWASSARGVSKIVSFRFANYDEDHGLVHDEVTAVFQRSDGSMVLGHGGGLTFFGDQSTALKFGDRLDGRVLDLAEDSRGNLWIAAFRMGLFRLDPTGNLKHYQMRSNWRGRVNSVLVDLNDKLWIATNGGVFSVDAEEFILHPLPRFFGGGLRRLFMDSQGQVLVCAINNGIWRYDGAKWRVWSDANDQINNVYAFLDSENKLPWVGTKAGLYLLGDDRLIKSSDPKIDRPIYFIVVDHDGQTWFGTDNGVLRWNGSELRHFTVKHGLAGRETNRAAGHVDTRGRIWIGTTNGLSIYRHEFDAGLAKPPLLSLLRAQAGDRWWPAENSSSLAHDHNAISIHYRVVSFEDENEILVRHRLEGLETEWSDFARPHEWKVHYEYLPPGTYQLHVQAAGVSGQWSDVISSGKFIIRSPFWQTAWFYALLLIVVAAIGYGLNRLLIQRKYARRLERDVAYRIADLERSEERFGVTLSCISDGVITTDIGGEVQFMNPAAERIIEKHACDVLGQELVEVFSFYDPVQCINELSTQIRQGSNWSSNNPLKIVATAGTLRLVDISTAPLRSTDKKLLGAVVVVRDVTQKFRLERQVATSQKLVSLGTLAGGIAHDFNNMLTVIMGSISAVRTARLDKDDQDSIEQIEAAIVQARRLTEQLLTFSKGGVPLLKTAYIQDLVRDSISFALRGSDVHCNLEIADDLLPVEIDCSQINQVLNNLLINARQSMPHGGIVHINARNIFRDLGARGTRSIEISITDQGCGIPLDQIDRVFEPYFTTKPKGTGIGLATAYSIVHRHQGELTVESKLGHGSTFRIVLPSAAETPAAPDTRSRPSNSLARILVVDDDPKVRKSLKAMLASVGYQVVCARDGNEAILFFESEAAGGHWFDAVLIDLTIREGMGGLDTIERLLEIDPQVCAIAISGYSDDPVFSDHESFGFRDCLRKPFTLDELKNVLRRVDAVQAG